MARRHLAKRQSCIPNAANTAIVVASFGGFPLQLHDPKRTVLHLLLVDLLMGCSDVHSRMQVPHLSRLIAYRVFINFSH